MKLLVGWSQNCKIDHTQVWTYAGMTWNIERIRGTYFNVDLHGDVGDHDKSDDTDDDDDGDGDNDDNKKTLGGTSIKDLSQKGESDMSHISIVYFRLLHWSQKFSSSFKLHNYSNFSFELVQ